MFPALFRVRSSSMPNGLTSVSFSKCFVDTPSQSVISKRVPFIVFSAHDQYVINQFWKDDSIKEYECAHLKPGDASDDRPPKAPIGPGNIS